MLVEDKLVCFNCRGEENLLLTSWSFLALPVAKWMVEGVVTPSAGLRGMVRVVKVYLLVEEQVVIRQRDLQREVEEEFW